MQMPPKAIEIYNKLIDEYNTLEEKIKTESSMMLRSLYKDKQRKAEKLFSKMFGKPIDKATKL